MRATILLVVFTLGACSGESAAPPAAFAESPFLESDMAAGCDSRFIYPLDGAVFPAGFPPPRFDWEVFMMRSPPSSPSADKDRGWTLTVFAGSQTFHVDISGDEDSWTPDPALWRSWSGKELRMELKGRDGEGDHRALPLRIKIEKHSLPDDVLMRVFKPSGALVPFSLNSAVDTLLLRMDTTRFETQELWVGRGRQKRCIGCHSAHTRHDAVSLVYTNNTPRPSLRGWVEMIPDKELGRWKTTLLTKTSGPFMQYSNSGEKVALSRPMLPPPGENIFYLSTSPGATSGNPLEYPAPFEFKYVSPTLDIIIHDRATGANIPLPGASTPDHIEIQPAWSPNDKQLAFVRHKGRGRMDIYVIDYNDGRGGSPSPLNGASGDGWDHYFPEYSPDGRWIAFTRSDASVSLFARPSSDIYLVPARGGTAHRLESNHGRDHGLLA